MPWQRKNIGKVIRLLLKLIMLLDYYWNQHIRKQAKQSNPFLWDCVSVHKGERGRRTFQLESCSTQISDQQACTQTDQSTG